MNGDGETTTAVQRRDLAGLTLPQRRLIQELAFTPDIQQACKNVEVKFSTLKSWLQKDKTFGDAYDELLGRTLDIAQQLIESSAVRASGVLEEALTAMKDVTVDVQCSGCGEHIDVEASRPDWNTRLAATRIISKIGGLIVDQHRVEKITFTPNLEEMLAIARARRGQPIPPPMRTKLLEKGVRLDENDPDPRKL